MSTVILALGANLGERERHLRSAVAGLGEAVRAVSDLYETAPWGDADQPAYLNALVVAADPTATPTDWLHRAWQLERAAGRRRDPARRYAPRTLDVDIIAAYSDTLPPDASDVAALREPVVGDEERLTLPHPRAAVRAFVLVPLWELAPDAELPGFGPVAGLLRHRRVADDIPGVRRLGAGGWWQAGHDD